MAEMTIPVLMLCLHDVCGLCPAAGLWLACCCSASLGRAVQQTRTSQYAFAHVVGVELRSYIFCHAAAVVSIASWLLLLP